MIEEDAHLRGSQRAPRSVIENDPYLVEGHTGEPLDELQHRSTIFEILEEGGYRDSGPAEDPGAAYALGIPLNSGTGRPINHTQS